jgi:undecaprenyl-diphosphatase
LRSKPVIHIALATCALLASAWLTIAVMSGNTLAFDIQLRERIHETANPVLTLVMKGITFLGSTAWIVTIATLAAFMMYQRGFRREAILLAFVVAGALLFNEELKLLVRRPRPAPFFDVVLPSSYSFPSGHALLSTSFYGAMAYLASRRASTTGRKVAIWAGAMVLIVLICLSRVYLGVHYPADVAGGFLIGCCWVNAVLACAKLP